MKRLTVLAAAIAAASIATTAVMADGSPNWVRERADGSTANPQVFIPIDGTPCFKRRAWVIHPEDVPLSSCTPTTTVAPTTTTAASTTTTPATTTTAVPTTTVPGGAQFVETFDNDTGLGRFDKGVYHRNLDDLGWAGGSGGSWTGDHDLACGTPDTQRTLSLDVDNDSMATRIANSFYVCKNHMMTSMGDVDNYSAVWFSPKQVFGSVDTVAFDVNLTDLGPRQWWKVGVVTEAAFNNGSFLVSDVDASNLPTNLASSKVLVATWSGQASAGYPGGKMAIGNSSELGASDPTPNDKATRHPVTLTDNHDGTITFTVAGVSVTHGGSFPACPCRVVFYDHNYTPDKDNNPQGHTWHWDNIVVT